MTGTARLVGTALAALVAIGLATGAASAQERSKIRMVFSISANTPVLPYLVAKDTGWYEKNGLDVEEIFLVGDANALRAVIAGNGDVAQFGLTTALQAIAEGDAKIKTIASWQPRVDYQFIALKGKYKSLDDFKGTVFASGSPGDLTFELPKMVMKKHNVDFSNINFVAVGPHPDRLKALEGGKAQTSMVNMLTARRGVEDGAVDIIRAVKDDFPDFGFSYLVTTDQNIADPKKHKAFEILVKGAMVGARSILKDPDGAAKVLSGRVPDLKPDFIKGVVVELNRLKVWGDDGGLQKDIVQFTSDLSVQYNQLAKPVKPEQIIDTQFVAKANAELKG